MPTPAPPATRRLTITLRRGLWLGIRPTIVVEGRGQPTQWGTGTWQVSADAPTEVTVFLFNRLWKFGQAEITVIATKILSRFRLDVQPGYTLSVRQMPTIGPRDGLPVTVRAAPPAANLGDGPMAQEPLAA